MKSASYNIVAFGFDNHFKEAITNQLPDVRFVDENIHNAPPSSLHDVDVALVFVFSKVRDDVLREMPNVEAIISLSAGLDHVDKDACEKRDIGVYNTPGYGSQTVAEQVFALLLTFERHIHVLQEENQLDFSREPYLSRQLGGKAFGVIGTGKIGRAAAKIAKGFDMDVLGYDVHHNEEFESIGRYASLSQIAQQSDYVSLHIPLLPSTENMWSEKYIRKMKSDALLVNVSRAGVLDEGAALESLENGTLRGLLLDVYSKNHYKQLTNRNDVLLTPHNAFYTNHAISNMVKTTKKIIEDL